MVFTRYGPLYGRLQNPLYNGSVDCIHVAAGHQTNCEFNVFDSCNPPSNHARRVNRLTTGWATGYIVYTRLWFDQQPSLVCHTEHPVIGWNAAGLYDDATRRCQLTDDRGFVVYSAAVAGLNQTSSVYHAGRRGFQRRKHPNSGNVKEGSQPQN